MSDLRPDTQQILAGLKDFQRDTVEYVFRRMYRDQDCTRRFLVADEVGLGKTLVARGVIARVIDYLWDRTDRIDIVYVCSNSDIARQNIQRLNVTGRQDVSHASRITLLPLKLPKMDSRLNFVSFTPGTSFELKSSGGIAEERALLFWMLRDAWGLDDSRASRPFEGTSGRKGFQYWVERVGAEFEAGQVHREVAEAFVESVRQKPELRRTYRQLLKAMPPRRRVPDELRRQCLPWISELRQTLAETCLHWLQPDLIILDEFQRFKELLKGDSDNASHAAQLADHLFRYQEESGDPETAARVLLLSATPYKMFTQSREAGHDDHYEDFHGTLNFLIDDSERQTEFHERLAGYREELFRLADSNFSRLAAVKRQLELSLRQVMVRTERLALKADRNGMLVEIPPANVDLKPDDVIQYLGLQQVARHVGHADVLEYWKSAPYLLNFMEDYDLKHKLRQAVQDGPDTELAKCVTAVGSGLLNRDDLERYRKLDPANARLRSLYADTVIRGAWKLLWVPPSLPYYEGAGAFADPHLKRFTKRLVFSSWRVVPKAVSSVLSYEAERCMMQRFRKKARNTAEARQKRRALLRFTFSKGRQTGMPVLAMLYPSRVLADQCDPLRIASNLRAEGKAATVESVRQYAIDKIVRLLEPVIDRFGDCSAAVDERWYWAAPLLLDFCGEQDKTVAWFRQDNLAAAWSGGTLSGDTTAARGWTRHVELARNLIQKGESLGRPPEKLESIVAAQGIAAPGVVSLRAVERVVRTHGRDDGDDICTQTGALAHAFLHLFNLPEVMSLLRDRSKEEPYWQSVLNYCVDGNLQSVMDEFAHVLVESLGLPGSPGGKIASEVSNAISHALTIRTSTAKADVITTGARSVRIDEENAVRMRTRFAMRFGDQDTEDGSETTRADSVRRAFNSPFWPFVLTTTSVGQEGLDFHPYCHAVVHWNLPSNPVDLEQREGRVHRYKGHALRKNIAAEYASAAESATADPWTGMFEAARADRDLAENDLYPFWLSPHGEAKIERYVPSLPHSREQIQKKELSRAVALYRMVFGQNRQEDLVSYLNTQLPADQHESAAELCRVDLSPPSAERGL